MARRKIKDGRRRCKGRHRLKLMSSSDGKLVAYGSSDLAIGILDAVNLSVSSAAEVQFSKQSAS